VIRKCPRLLDECLLGVAYLPDTLVASDLADGKLVEFLAEWSEPFADYCLYYPSRRHLTLTFRMCSMRCGCTTFTIIDAESHSEPMGITVTLHLMLAPRLPVLAGQKHL
jgi:hypothetical protein